MSSTRGVNFNSLGFQKPYEGPHISRKEAKGLKKYFEGKLPAIDIKLRAIIANKMLIGYFFDKRNDFFLSFVSNIVFRVSYKNNQI